MCVALPLRAAGAGGLTLSFAGFMSVYENYFLQYRVDFVVSGHVHAYERTHPMYNYAKDSARPRNATRCRVAPPSSLLPPRSAAPCTSPSATAATWRDPTVTTWTT